MTSPIRLTVWGENFHEQSERDRAGMAERYPGGMHGAIAAGLSELLGDSVTVSTATQDQPEHGLTEEVLTSTDVLTWWDMQPIPQSMRSSSTGYISAFSAAWVCWYCTPPTSRRSSVD